MARLVLHPSIHPNAMRAGLIDPRRKIVSSFRRLWRDSVRAFIYKMLEEIHYDTGMTGASLIPLAEQVRAKTRVTSEVTSRRVRKFRKGLTLLSGSYVAKDFKSMDAGRRAAKGASRVDFPTNTNPKAFFEFKITVFQHKFWEPSWNSIEAAERAFITFFRNNAEEYTGRAASIRRIVTGAN